jgi:hypothetical protein
LVDGINGDLDVDILKNKSLMIFEISWSVMIWAGARRHRRALF